MEKLYPSVGLAHKRVLRLLLLIILFIPNVSLSQTNLLLTRDLNSFETPIVTDPLGYEYTPSGSAWTFTGQSGLTKNGTAFTWANPNAPAQNQVLFLQNQGYVETTFNFPSNGYYRFLFKAAWREGCCEQPKYIRVLVDGVEAGEVELRSKNYEEYFTLPLELTSGNHTIRLEGDNPTVWGDYTGFVDDFRIQSLPVLVNYPYMTVQPGTTYVIGSSNYNFTLLKVRGTLVAPQNHDVNITSNYILVEDNGRFQIGQELSPYQEEATITLNGSNLNQFGAMGTKFLGAMDNGVIELHGKEKVSWTKLRETVNAGGSTIKVKDAVDWEVGDEIIIAPSGAPSSATDVSFANKYDKRTINSITNGNKDLTLNAGVTYRHTGVTKSYSGNGQTWTADIRAEVGLLTRNIKIQGDANTVNSSHAMYKKGAHMMIMGNAEAFINGIELYRVGQSAELGRYPFHWHVRGNADGQYFKNSSVHQSYNRALTIHGTDNVLVENSVFFDHIGHGIFFEIGSEQGNKILGNLVIGSKKPVGTEILTTGETIDEFQNRGPASYWITHPNNTIEGNVAAGTIGTGFWYIFPHNDLGPGLVNPQKAPFGSFKNNVAHSTSNGFDIFDELRWDHSVEPNYGYVSTSDYEILDCTWYANRIGVYTGTGQNNYNRDEYNREIYIPNEHLIFKNNIFADNEKAVMLASDNQVKNTLFVEDTGHGNAPVSGQSLVFMYDGAATISNSHIVGYNTNANSMMSFAGAEFTYGNFRFKDVTKANSIVFNVSSSVFNNVGRRNVTIYDEDGSLSGIAGSTLVVPNSFNLLGGETTPSGWTNFKRTSRRYVNTRLRVHLSDQLAYGWVPDVNVVRTKPGTLPQTISKVQDTPTLPFIMNDIDLLYTFEWVYGTGEDINTIMDFDNRRLQFKLARTAKVLDFVIVRFKDMGTLPGVYVDMNSEELVRWGAANQAINSKTSLAALKSSTTSAYYNDGNDIYIKAVATGHFAQFFSIKWFAPLGGVANNTATLEGEQSLTGTKQSIYPNPASTKLYIKGLAEGEEVQIIDVNGSLLQTTIYEEYLDISKLKSGLYVIRTKSGNHRFIKE